MALCQRPNSWPSLEPGGIRSTKLGSARLLSVVRQHGEAVKVDAFVPRPDLAFIAPGRSDHQA